MKSDTVGFQISTAERKKKKKKNSQPEERKLSQHFSSQQRGNFQPERVGSLAGCERIMTNYEENE